MRWRVQLPMRSLLPLALAVTTLASLGMTGGGSTKSAAAAGLAIDQLHPLLAQRFNSLTNDRFGISRAPRRYHIQGGVINPEPLKKYQADAGPNFKPFGTAELPTEPENKLIEQLRDTGFDFEVYTVGLQSEDGHSRLRGPVGAVRFEDNEPKRDEVEAVGNLANKSKLDDAVNTTSPDGKVFFKAKSIRINSTRCLACHTDLKVGDKVGAIVYRYWQRD